MPRGQKAEPGEIRIAKNGYSYTKTKDRGWMLTHHLMAEESLGRRLRENERVHFKDSNRTNLSHDNIAVREVKNSKDDRLKRLKERKKMIDQEIKDLEHQLGKR